MATASVTRVVSTGSGIALGYLPYLAARGVPCHYIESAARVAGPSRTGRVLRACRGIRRYTQYAQWAGAHGGTTGAACSTTTNRPATGGRRAASSASSSPSGRRTEFPFRRLVERLVPLLAPDGELARPPASRSTSCGRPGARPTGHLPIAAPPFLPGEKLAAAVADADLVVSHAGVGSALTALAAGHRPVLADRSAALGEFRDDHQRQIAVELQRRGLAVHRAPVGAHGRRPRARPCRRASAGPARPPPSSCCHDEHETAPAGGPAHRSPLGRAGPRGRAAACSPRRPGSGPSATRTASSPRRGSPSTRPGRPAGRRRLDRRGRPARRSGAWRCRSATGPTRSCADADDVAARQRRPAGRRPAVHPAVPRRLPRGRRSPVRGARGGGLAHDGAGPAAGRTARRAPAADAAQHRHRANGRGSRSSCATTRTRWSEYHRLHVGLRKRKYRLLAQPLGLLRADLEGVRAGRRAAHRAGPGRRTARGRRGVPGLGGHRLLQVRRLAGGVPAAATERRPPLAAHPLGPRARAADPRLGPVRPRSAGPGRLQAQLGQPGGPDRDPERRRPPAR